MNFQYTLKIPLPLDQAWQTVMDLERIAPCMPGATIESRDGDDLVGRLKVKLGPIEMTYRGNIHFVARDDEAKTATVDAAAKEIKGRGAAKTQVTLAGIATADGSEITLVSEFTVSGKAAQFGRGVMEEVGEKLMDQFAQRVGAQISAGRDAGDPAPAVATASGTPSAQSKAPEDEQITPATTTADATATGRDSGALDLGQAAWWPVLKRMRFTVIGLALALIYFWLKP
jgi:carbon monoxide dehydrogenase subunit G